jgi:hypothetical protein
MSVKNTSAVNQYTAMVCEIQSALANLSEWAESLPAPDDNNELANLHYGHLGTVEHIHGMLAQVSKAADSFND